MDIIEAKVRQVIIAVVIMIAAIIMWFVALATGRNFKELPAILIIIFLFGVVSLVGALRINHSTSMKK